MDFKNKVAVVTGGALGIGLACCREFAQRNASAAVVDLNEKAGRSVVKEVRQFGGKAEFFPFDVSKSASVAVGVAKIVRKLGGIDILINNAGIQRYGTATTASEEDWDLVLTVNLKSAFLMSKYVIPAMIKRGGGAIVNTGSIQSGAAQSNSVHYVVSKHGILGLTRSVALDYAKKNIRANCVLPGGVDTPMVRWSASLTPDPEATMAALDRIHMCGKMGKPEEVARVAVFLSSDLA
jgi:NAD(P)-dependent dehydrogenase (short-subunit alcohol dehydrogenase family)